MLGDDRTAARDDDLRVVLDVRERARRAMSENCVCDHTGDAETRKRDSGCAYRRFKACFLLPDDERRLFYSPQSV